jgi:peptide/nickel transport system substrate-binding protein
MSDVAAEAVRVAVSRRSALRLVLAGSGAALLAACASPAPPASSVPATAVGPAAPAAAAVQPKPGGKPKTGGTLRSAIQADIPNVEPHAISPSAYDTVWQAFDRLTAFDAKLQPRPMLAESWDLTPDFRQITLHLRKGVEFHSGREFTSGDVKYNFIRVRDPKVGGSGLANQSNWWTSIDTPDKYTVVLKSDVPRPLVFDSFEYFNMADRETLEGPDSETNAVGTGPFVFSEWVQGDHIQLVKNQRYWASARPFVDEMNIRIVRDAQAMVAQLESGAVDLIFTPAWNDFARLKADPKFQGIIHPYTGSWYTIGWNVTSEPIANKKVRQALNYALDRTRFVEKVLLGFGKPKSLPWLENSPAYDSARTVFYSFDLDRAKSLLAEAGASNLETEMLLGPDFPELVQFAQIYQADLAAIGVKLNIKQVESAAFFDAINNRKYPGMYMIVTGRVQLQPGTVLLSSAGLNPVTNNSGFKSEQYTRLANATAAETDPAKARELYQQINSLLLDEAFTLALAARSPRLLVKSNVHDLGYTLHDGYDWTGVWLD